MSLFHSEVIANLVKNEHAYRMLAVLARLGVGDAEGMRNTIAIFAPDEAGEPILKDHPGEGYNRVWTERGLLSTGKLLEQARKVIEFNEWEGAVPGVASIDLANPRLPSDFIRETLGRTAITVPCVAGLKANPNCPESLRSTDGMPDEHKRYHMLALARYGDLNHKETNALIVKLIDTGVVAGQQMKPHLHQIAIRYLCGRKDLTEALVVRLDGKCQPREYTTLATHPLHRKAVSEGRVHGLYTQSAASRDPVGWSQELSSTQLDSIYQDADSGPHPLQVRLTAAAHPNAKAGLINDLLVTAKLERTETKVFSTLVANGSPHTRMLFDRFREEDPTRISSLALAKWADTPPRALLESAQGHILGGSWKGAVHFTSHPSFPWAETADDFLRSISKPDASLSATCCKAAAGALTPNEERALLAKNPLPLLFVRATAGATLVKIAHANPEYAGVAALHPNGTNVPRSCVDTSERADVDFLRNVEPGFELPGRGRRTSGTHVTVLTI